ncbi:MAG TPA: DUF3276 family protein [Bacteroidales bacterium]|nr:DUF3276 family protein [Bacteroidales bacterium]
MEELENKERDREEIFSRAVRAGKRTYFFDVKATVNDEYYITITESKKRFNNEQGKFFYEKHKLFLYKEDFDKFAVGLNDAVEFIRTGRVPEHTETDDSSRTDEDAAETRPASRSIEFEDLLPGSDTH